MSIANAERPTIVCLCGSTRFSQAFRDANLRETLAGQIVLSIGCDMRSDTEIFGDMSADELAAVKQRLDDLHKRKIDLADEILVLNVGGYIGESTMSEIVYAFRAQKRIRYLEQPSSDFAKLLLVAVHADGRQRQQVASGGESIAFACGRRHEPAD